MKRRKKALAADHLLHQRKLMTTTSPQMCPVVSLRLAVVLLIAATAPLLLQPASSLLLLKANCLTNWPGCVCSWRGGKFVADCAAQNLSQVPKNDYHDYLLENSGDKQQMQTLQRDIQLLNLSSNQIGQLNEIEFYEKKFGNLQKMYLNANKLRNIHTSAFYKLTGLIELDMSENLLTSFKWLPPGSGFGHNNNQRVAPTTTTRTASNDTNDAADQVVRTDDSGGGGGGSDRSKLTSSFKTNTTSAAGEMSKVTPMIKPRVKTKTFLHDLTQLRQLNLNSNQLRRIGPFTFSPLVQLRQLYLSKNKIQSIDKQAFDGLNVLNILHLDHTLVFGKWPEDNQYHIIVKLLRLDETKRRAYIRYEDGTECWAELSTIHLQFLAPSQRFKSDDDIVCCVCDDGTPKAPNEIIICDICQQSYHEDCHSPKIKNSVIDLSQENEWVCSTCGYIENQLENQEPSPHETSSEASSSEETLTGGVTEVEAIDVVAEAIETQIFVKELVREENE